MTRAAYPVNRRQFLAAGLGAAGAVAAGVALGRDVWPLLAEEDLVPGAAPRPQLLPPRPGTTTPDQVHVRRRWATTAAAGARPWPWPSAWPRPTGAAPFGLVALLGDICYYGNIEDRFDDVFRPADGAPDRRRGPLRARHRQPRRRPAPQRRGPRPRSRPSCACSARPAATTRSTHGPADFFYLDSSVPGLFGAGASEQLEWLDGALGQLGQPVEGRGPAPPAVLVRQARLHPGFRRGAPGAVLDRHHVDLVLAGHDHHYERTHPLDGHHLCGQRRRLQDHPVWAAASSPRPPSRPCSSCCRHRRRPPGGHVRPPRRLRRRHVHAAGPGGAMNRLDHRPRRRRPLYAAVAASASCCAPAWPCAGRRSGRHGRHRRARPRRRQRAWSGSCTPRGVDPVAAREERTAVRRPDMWIAVAQRARRAGARRHRCSCWRPARPSPTSTPPSANRGYPVVPLWGGVQLLAVALAELTGRLVFWWLEPHPEPHRACRWGVLPPAHRLMRHPSLRRTALPSPVTPPAADGPSARTPQEHATPR